MTNLIRNYVGFPEEHWTVTHVVEGEIVWKNFNTIELACELMNSLGIGDDDIDLALIDLFAFKHVRAMFDNNRFHHTQDY